METNSQPLPPNDPLQFDRVEPVNPSGPAATPVSATACAACQQPIANLYYELGGRPLCARCKEGISAVITGGSRIARFFKALLFGMGAAVISAAVWIGIIKLTGYELALVAIIVGLFVGAAVRKGANARGGWLYQGMAVILTYLAITGSYVPLVIDAILQGDAEASQQLVASDAERTRIAIARDGSVSVNGKAATVEEAVQEVHRINSDNGFILYYREGRFAADAPPSAETIGDEWDKLELPVVPCSDAGCENVERMTFGNAELLGKALLVGIGFYYSVQTPFLEGASGLIGLLIIGFALWEAWKMNKRPVLNITGPHVIMTSAGRVAETPRAALHDNMNPVPWSNNPRSSSSEQNRPG